MKLLHRTNQRGVMLVIDGLPPINGEITAVRINGKWFGPAADNGGRETTVAEDSVYEREWEESAPTMNAHDPNLLNPADGDK